MTYMAEVSKLNDDGPEYQDNIRINHNHILALLDQNEEALESRISFR